MTDEMIVELYWQRSEQAITESAARYGRYCHMVARNILYNEEDSEECVNDTWMNAWKAMPPHRPSILRSFLGKLTRNLALNRYEHEKAKKRGGGEVPLVLEELAECVGIFPETERLAERMVLTEAVNRFLREESEESRKTFVQRYWYLRTVKEIASEFSMSESKVKMLLLRARERLRERLEREEIYI